MHDGPHEQREPAGEAQAGRGADGAVVADDGQAALVQVPEGARRAASGEPGADDLGCVAALLHCGGRDARDAVDGGHVADREHLGPARERQVAADDDPPGRVHARARGVREHARERRRRDAGGPQHGPGLDAAAVGELEPVGVQRGRGDPGADVDAEALEVARGTPA